MAFEHYDKCALLLPMDGANNGTVFTDWSPNPKTVTVNGNAKTSTAQSKYYGSSGYLDGAGDYLGTPLLDYTQSKMTIMAWIRPSSLAAHSSILSSRFDGGPPTPLGFFIRLNTDGAVRLVGYDAAGSIALDITSTTKVSINTWTHIAAIKNGSNWAIYVAGSMDVNGNQSAVITDRVGGFFCIGADGNNATGYFTGNIQDVAVFYGNLWTSNFTPPEKLIGEIAGTVRDKDDAIASRIITAVPRANPTRAFSTTSSAVDGTYSLRVPATECSRIALADETTLYNDIVDRIIPE